MVKRKNLHGYKYLEDTQMKYCQQRITGRVIHVWLAKYP